MSRSSFELFCFKVFGVQRSVWNCRFGAIRVFLLVVEFWSVLGLRVFVWIVLLRRLRCPEVGVGIPNLTSGHLRRDLELHVCLYFPWKTNNLHRFPSDLAFSDFVFQCTQHTQDARDIQGGQGIQDIQDTQHARDTRRLRDARGTHRIRDAILIFKCPEVGSCFLLSGASSKMMSSVSWFFFSLFVSMSFARPDVGRNFARVDLLETSRAGPHPEGSENCPNGSGVLRDRKTIRNDRSLDRNSNRIGPPPGPVNLAS